MPRWPLAGCTGALLLLSGCDTIYGIGSQAELTAKPDIHCVDTALRRLPGVEVVHFEPADPNLSPSEDRFDAIWLYKTRGGEAQLQIHWDRQEKFYRNGDQIMGRQVPVSEMDAIEPSLRAVDTALFATCHLQSTAPLKLVRIT